MGILNNKVSISKIAEDLGVSVSTVSRALSGSGRISDATRQRITEYLKDKKLVPNTRMKKYTDVTTNMVAVIFPDINHISVLPYFYHVFFSIYNYFSIRGYQVFPVMAGKENMENVERLVEQHLVDGIVLTHGSIGKWIIEYLQKCGVPFVTLGSVNNPEIPQVETDDEGASRDITNALIHRGLYRIAIIGGEKNSLLNRRRYKGILSAHVQNHMVIDEEYVFFHIESENSAEIAVDKILSGRQDCILCMDARICLDVLKALRKTKAEIPADIKIASLYDSEFLDQWCPAVSCVHFDLDALGREAAKLLYRNLTEYGAMTDAFLGYEIRMKESTN